MSLIIQCGPNRRIRRYHYGWRLEILGKKKGEDYWREDSPAYPANLGNACQEMMERILADRDAPICPEDLAGELAHAVEACETYFARAREVGTDLESDLGDFARRTSRLVHELEEDLENV